MKIIYYKDEVYNNIHVHDHITSKVSFIKHILGILWTWVSVISIGFHMKFMHCVLKIYSTWFIVWLLLQSCIFVSWKYIPPAIQFGFYYIVTSTSNHMYSDSLEHGCVHENEGEGNDGGRAIYFATEWGRQGSPILSLILEMRVNAFFSPFMVKIHFLGFTYLKSTWLHWCSAGGCHLVCE
jgi:hypothetical protein